MLHALIAAAIFMSGNYNGDSPAGVTCGPGTVQVGVPGSQYCVAAQAPQVAPQTAVVVQQPQVLIPTGFAYGFPGFGFHHWR